MEANPQVTLMWDGDEYLFVLRELTDLDPTQFPISLEQRVSHFSDREYYRIALAIYYQLRASVCPIRSISGENFERVWQLSREAAENDSHYLASRIYYNNLSVTPKWLNLISRTISEHPFALVRSAWERTKVTNHYTPSVQPYIESVDGDYVLHMPIMLRGFLKQLNMPFNNIWSIIETPPYAIEDVETQLRGLHLMLLTHSWFVREEFHPASLPIYFANSTLSSFQSGHTATLQVLFLTLHELGHVALNHLDGTRPTGSFNRYLHIALEALGMDPTAIPHDVLLEIEADIFAIQMLREQQDFDIDECMFAIMTVMDYLRLFEATSTMTLIDDGNQPNLVEWFGNAAIRRKVAGWIVMSSWEHEGYKRAYKFFQSNAIGEFEPLLRMLRQEDLFFLMGYHQRPGKGE